MSIPLPPDETPQGTGETELDSVRVPIQAPRGMMTVLGGLGATRDLDPPAADPLLTSVKITAFFDALTGEDSRPPSLVGVVLAGKYELVRLIGEGGMGEVYAGRHTTLRAPIAVKLLHPHIAANPDLLRRFRREAVAVSRLQHPNIVRVIDFDQDKSSGLFFMVMEFLEGDSLADYLGNLAAPPPLGEVMWVMAGILNALETAHMAGVVHRDLKPGNVLLSRTTSGERIVKVLDFGLAHVEDVADDGPTLTKGHMVAGTPRYMSPEQCRSLAVGPSTDLYALGCVLTELLQLRPPFRGKSPVETASMQMFLPPPDLERPEGAEPVPPLLERLRLDLLAKLPEQRPVDANDTRIRLAEAMSPEASAARRPARKSDTPLGGRAERTPEWDERAKAPSTATSTGTSTSGPREARLVRLGGGEGGVEDACVAGLAAQGIAISASATIVIVDAGADFAGACATLAELPASARAIVCVARPSSEQMNQLIAAGAADVVAYPVTADALGKKIDRAARRRR